jgi:hypothetical protein
LKTKEILSGKAAYLIECGAMKSIKRLWSVSLVGLIFTITSSAFSASIMEIFDGNGWFVPPLVTNLLAAPLTDAERQMLHAQNFNQLPASAQVAYLHTVAFAIGSVFVSGGNLPTAVMLEAHLKTVHSLCTIPAVPSECSKDLASHVAAVNNVLKELNAKFAGVIVNNPSLSQAMLAGAVSSYFGDTLFDPN